MNRREALKRTALLMGGAIFAPNALGVLQGCTARPGTWYPTFFTNEQALVVEELAEIILPADEDPGAKDVGVPEFIEKMVAEVYEQEERESFIEELEEFNKKAVKQFNAPFYNCTQKERKELAKLENTRLKNLPGDVRPFFLNVKELTVLGYFTTKTVATEVINHIAIPGEYNGCIPYEQIGTVWAER